jgi:uncharacterized protein (DUF58 family)
MLSREILAKIRRIELRAASKATELLSGEYSSKFKGRGMEFDEVREYVPGDDIRSIDWNVTARMSRPFVKVFREEREMTILLMVDVSESLEFGIRGRTKLEVAAEFAAVIAFLALRNNDRVGLVSFGGGISTFIPPKKGRGHIWRIIRAVLTHGYSGDGTDIGATAEFVNRVQKRRANVFLISDLISDKNYRNQLTQLDRRHDLTLIAVNDKAETSFGDHGLVAMVDAESGTGLTARGVSTSIEGQRQNMDKYVRQQFAAARGLRAGQIPLWTDEDIIQPLERFLRNRGGRGR